MKFLVFRLLFSRLFHLVGIAYALQFDEFCNAGHHTLVNSSMHFFSIFFFAEQLSNSDKEIDEFTCYSWITGVCLIWSEGLWGARGAGGGLRKGWLQKSGHLEYIYTKAQINFLPNNDLNYKNYFLYLILLGKPIFTS